MSTFKPNRRDFIRTSAIAGAALTVPGLMRKAHATTLPDSEYFDLSAGSTEFMRDVVLGQTSGAAQSFAFNGGDNCYVLQTLDDADGNLTFSRLTPDHALDGYMTLTGAGHGVAMGIDDNGSGSDYYWTESEEASDGTGTCRGRKLQRFTFSSGATYSASSSEVEVYDPTIHLEGTTQWQVTCSIDQTNHRIAVRYAKQQVGGTEYYNIYDLDDFNNHTYNPYFATSVATPPSSTLPSDIGVSQGWCLYGSWIYMLWGTAQSTCPGTESGSESAGTYVGRFSLNDRSTWITSQTNAGYSICHREPEGIAVRTYGGVTQLHMGFSGYDDGDGSSHHFSTYYKDVLVQP